MNQKRESNLRQFITRNNLEGISIELLNQALTHKSYANELKGQGGRDKSIRKHNQRLEFLGDAILGLIIAKTLYDINPDANEGELTKKKSMAVCEPTLAEIGDKLELGNYLLMGKGEIQTGGINRSSNVADALESLIGCIYISVGINKAEEFVAKNWKPYLEETKIALFSVDHKSILQEFIVKSRKTRPEYRVLETEGPEHQKIFLIGLYINGQEIGRAKSNSRKKAEQQAAFDYLKKNNILT
ncbi:MAG: ribonuclease III [Spirochaetia bacterium]|nr:ribonuclease III [Spirochaetia bacterium]